MPNHVNKDLLSRIQAALLGVMIGDGMGMPWEMMTPAEILAASDGRGVTGFATPVQRRIGGTRNLPAGHPTDDWQLTEAIAKSLATCGEFNLEDIARRHVVALEQSTMGWGGSTRSGIAAIKEYFDSHGAHGRHWSVAVAESPAGKGTGNGVAMKILPLAIWHACQGRSTPPWEEMRAVGLLTHADLRASLAAYAVTWIAGISMAVAQIGTVIPTLKVRTELIDRISYFEQSVLPRTGEKKLSDKLVMASRCHDSEIALRDHVGTGCYCLESVPFAIATFWRHPTDFRTAVLEAINAGGDTDTTAAMVGGLVGANVGLEGIPAEWRTFRPEYAEALSLGEQLYTAASAVRY